MVSMSDIEELAVRIVSQFDPDKIILFGSYARGSNIPSSAISRRKWSPASSRERSTSGDRTIKSMGNRLRTRLRISAAFRQLLPAQQCAEKYLKARLVEENVDFPRTHDLVMILNLVLHLEPTWGHLRDELDALTALGVEVRYPGTVADLEDADEAIRTASRVRDLVRPALGLAA